jgi:hypothetical protein
MSPFMKIEDDPQKDTFRRTRLKDEGTRLFCSSCGDDLPPDWDANILLAREADVFVAAKIFCKPCTRRLDRSPAFADRWPGSIGLRDLRLNPLPTLRTWHEEMGPVLWWRFPMEEAPWAGTPHDSDWPMRQPDETCFTHWTPLPALPATPPDRAGEEG